uniref:Uncharacterized protein n=1 Tax=Chromera velia CCMP2878 TaxID=1169474 RepID=A0A0G4HZU8_9ALVE|eukprot:Cvel_9786.t1-p1 / transcript=Cvel_9786.t1 / gene=Cvel_9786 / organism=Chromera_velia_CCMP2878 / gene_product=Ultraviolet-B receptor UVR8, putative / transcript_product=Ultraviolet-B receptor UVR8, putative / location=Cvel_scaffold574:18272-22575(+) / protein_length=726 / sequence_SO=supercontig / SO=protein_coding / is_pseudo=false
MLSRISDRPLSVGLVEEKVDLQCPRGVECSHRLGEKEWWSCRSRQSFTFMQCLAGQLVVAKGSRYVTCAGPHPHDTIQTALDLSDRFSAALAEGTETTSVEGVWLGATGDPDFSNCGGMSDSPGGRAVVGALSGSGCPSDFSACQCEGSIEFHDRELSWVLLEGGGPEVFLLVRPYRKEERGPFNLTVTLSAPHPHNTIQAAFDLSDRFSPAIAEGVETTSVEGNWEGTTGDEGFGECGGNASRSEIWYRLRLPESSGRLVAVSVDTCTGTSGWDEKSCSNGRSRVSFMERGGSEVFVVIGQKSDSNSFNLTVIVELQPKATRPTRVIARGASHSLAVDDQGDLFGFGSNIHGQLGLEDRGNFRLPTRVPFVSAVVDACAGGEHDSNLNEYPAFSLVLLRNGTVISFGDNRYGQLGNVSGDQGGEDGEWKPLHVEELEGERVVGVACGGLHSAAWTEQGSLFMWGRGEERQLGLGDREDRHTASLVNASILEGESVMQVALGGGHTLVACRSGRLFSWGGNGNGQLGNGTYGSGERETSPVEVFLGTEGEKVLVVAAGWYHSLVLTSSGKVFGFGRDSDGQLGLGNSDHSLSTPQWVEKLPEEMVEIAAGSRHSFVRVKDGRVFSFGRNEEGQLGLGHSSDQREPVEVEGVRAERLWKGGSLSDSSLLISEGGVVGAAKNREGQLGLGGGGGLSNLELSFEPLLGEALLRVSVRPRWALSEGKKRD